MKIKMKKPVWGILLAVALLLGFSACAENAPPYEMNSEAILTALSIGNVEAETIPAAIESIEWDNWDTELYGEGFETMSFNRESDVTRVRIIPTASDRSRTEWGIGDRSTRPAVFTDTRVPASFSANDYVYIKVVSEDTTITNYYRFYARVFNSVTHLADVFIDGKRFNIKEGGGEWDSVPDTQVGDIALTTIQAVTNGVEIEAVGFDSTSTFQFAKVAGEDGGDVEPVFFPNNRFNFEDQDYFYVEVTAQNTVDKAYYKFKVSVARIATIAKLSLSNIEVTGKGIPNDAWDKVLVGSFADAHYKQPGAGYAIDIVLDDPAGSYQYSLLSTPKDNENTANYVDTGPIKFGKAEGSGLVIKITSENEEAWNYYKIEVELLATKFLQQPRSAAYYYYHPVAANEWDYVSPTVFESETPEELDFVLEQYGNYSYQWYESNSWYGGYGFDIDGRITTSGSANTAETWEAGFIVDEFHVREYDEKANITIFNGGNNNARYVIPGRAISASTTPPLNPENFNLAQGAGNKYTPKINFRPFLPKYTNETHYYWVVITDLDTGYELTSERAVIVSERNKNKKHHVFDVNNYYAVDGTTKIAFKNQEPFEKKFDKYKIPLHFEGDFNINDYSTMYAQAKFYLKDGTPWIQNWTNGNISFEVDGAIKVLYYNLTSDGASKGLANGGNEPAGSGINETPTHVVIEPSGDDTKGPNKDGFPPLGSDGKPLSKTEDPNNWIFDGTSAGNLQGWFCGYIELVEFRFEGPAR
jgi:hypothetical protein